MAEFYSDICDPDIEVVEEIIICDDANHKNKSTKTDKNKSNLSLESQLANIKLLDHDYVTVPDVKGEAAGKGMRGSKCSGDSVPVPAIRVESGVDMGFDALMDLEENSDLVNFMKNYINDENVGDDFRDVWDLSQHQENSVAHHETDKILRNESLYEAKSAGEISKVVPTFKQSTPSSRTNLRQLLWREQCLEQERKRALREQQGQTQLGQSSSNIPITQGGGSRTEHGAVPNEVYKVDTRLENPTKYHMLESQRRQVQEYLFEGSAPPGACLPLPQVSEIPEAASAPVLPCIRRRSGPLSPVQRRRVSGPLSPVSVFSSAATSPSEYAPSEVCDELLEEILANGENLPIVLDSSTGEKTTNGALMDLLVKEEPLGDQELRAMQKDRVKKDNHNMIERRRRFNINDRIKELGTLLPKQNEAYFEIVRDVRQNKGSILKASVDYIRLLKRDREKREAMEEKFRKLEQTNRKTLLKLQEYEERLSAAGLAISGTTWRPATSQEIQQLATNNKPVDVSSKDSSSGDELNMYNSNSPSSQEDSEDIMEI